MELVRVIPLSRWSSTNKVVLGAKIMVGPLVAKSFGVAICNHIHFLLVLLELHSLLLHTLKQVLLSLLQSNHLLIVFLGLLLELLHPHLIQSPLLLCLLISQLPILLNLQLGS